jgi:hypothetical protein
MILLAVFSLTFLTMIIKNLLKSRLMGWHGLRATAGRALLGGFAPAANDSSAPSPGKGHGGDSPAAGRREARIERRGEAKSSHEDRLVGADKKPALLMARKEA